VARPFEERIRKAAAGRRRLSVWLRLHHDEIVKSLGSGRVWWGPIHDIVVEEQLVDDRGRTPSPEAIARIWRRVRRHVAAERLATVASRSAPDEIAFGVRLVQDAPSFPADAEAAIRPDRPPITFLPARPASGVSAPVGLSAGQQRAAFAPPETTTVADGDDRREPDALTEKLRAAVRRAGRGPIPLPEPLS